MTKARATALLFAQKWNKELKGEQRECQSGDVQQILKLVIRFWETSLTTAGLAHIIGSCSFT